MLGYTVILLFIIMSAVVEEWTIPVPWGQISGKSWGVPGKKRVLAIHGLNDNAASFDQLILHLSNQLFVVCVDLPGHGLSSHFPAGLYFSLLDYTCALKRVVDHFQWTQFSILAHSFGSHVAAYFTALFEQCVTHIVMFDMYMCQIIPEDGFIIERCQYILDRLFMLENNKDRVYSYEDSLKKLCGDRMTQLGIKSAMALQKRAFRKTSKGYSHNNDRRLKLSNYPLITSNFHFNLINNINCYILVIASSEFEPFLSILVTQSTLDTLRQRLGHNMKVVRVQGSHDVHMDNPERVVPLVKQFFFKDQSHL